MKKLGIFCLLFMIALSACRKDKDDVTTTETPYIPPIINWDHQSLMVNSSLTGFVVDDAGEPITDAAVKVGNMNTTTDEFGHFFLNDISLDAKGTVVTVTKSGYFNGSRRFLAVENQTNRVKIEMITKSFDYGFDASDGGTVQTSDGASIVFSANSIKKADGSAYTGEVKVAAKWLDPSNVATFDRMPGNLQGVSREVEEVALGTYGMMAVELESPAGEALNIMEESTATLTMPVPASLQGNAPSEIPLWSYSEEHGVWVEEEFTATLVNGSYVGEVSHFSFWNCDYPYPLVEFTAVITNQNGDPLANYKVVITLASANGVGTGAGYTCPDGTITGLIPANQSLNLEIFGICGELLHSENIGPFSDDVDLGTIAVDQSVLNQINVTGELVDCDGITIANGLAIFEFDNEVVYHYVSGAPFDVSFGICNNTTDITLTGVDLDKLLESDPVNFTASNTNDLGEIDVCDIQIQDYIKVNVDDGSGVVTAIYKPAYVYPDTITPTGGIGTSFSFYENNNPNQAINIWFSVDGSSAGDYSNTNNIYSFSDPDKVWDFGQGQAFSSFIIDEYGNVGEPVKGTFEGTFTNFAVQPNTTVTVTGEFDIIR